MGCGIRPQGDDKADAVVLGFREHEVYYDSSARLRKANQPAIVTSSDVQITDGTSQGIGYGNEGYQNSMPKAPSAQSARRGRHFQQWL